MRPSQARSRQRAEAPVTQSTPLTYRDAGVDIETGQQLENKILERARLLKASEIG